MLWQGFYWANQQQRKQDAIPGPIPSTLACSLDQAIKLAYRHGLRAQELRSLRWAQVDLRNGRLHVNRAKGGIESVHPLHGPELRALRPLQDNSPYVFTTEASTPVTTAWFLRMIQRTGVAAKLPFQVHPHMLRHSTGYKLASTWSG